MQLPKLMLVTLFSRPDFSVCCEGSGIPGGLILDPVLPPALSQFYSSTRPLTIQSVNQLATYWFVASS